MRTSQKNGRTREQVHTIVMKRGGELMAKKLCGEGEGGKKGKREKKGGKGKKGGDVLGAE